ncbi:MAG: YeeE/YedE family protein [Paracoccus sp. (in: a-proteobacteria)]|nr:YeeE/YedE family protein [Paracoccus sp. (in: a-proteobacteria)]
MQFEEAMVRLSEWAGDPLAGLMIGTLVGLTFGFCAQRSTFCLRSAAVEVARGQLGRRLAIWLLAFATALFWVQIARVGGLFDPAASWMMQATASWSGAIIGGLIFGFGMVLARGCSGRLVVLAGTGNLRSMVAGMVFAITAQATIAGVLQPVRLSIAGVWASDGANHDLLSDVLSLPPIAGVVIGAVIALLAILVALRAGTQMPKLVFASGAGFAVAVGWLLTYNLSTVAFDPVQVNSVTFSGPSGVFLNHILSRAGSFSFELALVPATLVGSFIGGLVGRELRWESYSSAGQMVRSIAGGALMGFGGVLAAGCAIGAGLSGTSIFVATAWLTTLCFFIGSWAADLIFDREAAQAGAPVQVQR